MSILSEYEYKNTAISLFSTRIGKWGMNSEGTRNRDIGVQGVLAE